ncbi:hypothetical protein M0R45_025938 [Rubus argutus]|uniref:Uncharacterized protein n=1 Tax=Rubus argutus TaxID=59490 RepID=A0AAW1WXU6_RUBAR
MAAASWLRQGEAWLGCADSRRRRSLQRLPRLVERWNADGVIGGVGSDSVWIVASINNSVGCCDVVEQTAVKLAWAGGLEWCRDGLMMVR